MNKKIFALVVLFFSVAHAVENGIHFTFNFNRDQGDTAAVGKASYFYQSGDMFADIDMTIGAIQHISMLQKGDVLYKLDSKEKTFMEIPQALRDAAKNMVQSEDKGAFTTTKKKKKIASYDCEIFTRKTLKTTDTVCLNQELFQKYKNIFIKMKEMSGTDDMIGAAQGFPLEIQSVGTGTNKTKTSILITSIENGNYASKLIIPPGYQEKSPIAGGLEMLKKMTEHP